MLGAMGSLSKTLALRTAQGFCVVGITAALALAIPRWARPDLYPDEQGWGGLADAMSRAFLHFDFGGASALAACARRRERRVNPLLRAGIRHRARNAAAVQRNVRNVPAAVLLRRRASRDLGP